MSERHRLVYDERIEDAVDRISVLLSDSYFISKRAVSLLLLQEDEDITQLVEATDRNNYEEIRSVVEQTKKAFDRPLSYVIGLTMHEDALDITERSVTRSKKNRRTFASVLSDLTMHPLSGTIILLLVLYFGLYKFVGEFGAGTVVDFLEENLFEGYINPFLTRVFEVMIPWRWLQELFVHDYGLLTLGMRYAIAIILPIVGTFFLVFSIIEDSGYLPRLAMLVDRVFKKIGLNGRAVIPMTLGFGCGTMATIVTRTLESKREKVISTLLLALAIPCSAQLGVILAMLSVSFRALAIWMVFVALSFLLVGFLAARLYPGKKPSFYMEVPPLRVPKISNVLSKTLARMKWYLVEVIPIFLGASVIIWIGNLTGAFNLLVRALHPVMSLVGLPAESAQAFIFGFFRRDYGAAGLYDLRRAGVLDIRQILVASAILTLFVPCVAQFAVMIKERGLKTALWIAGFVFVFAFAAGALLNGVLQVTGLL
jgi:ferrous iron transport protein B